MHCVKISLRGKPHICTRKIAFSWPTFRQPSVDFDIIRRDRLVSYSPTLRAGASSCRIPGVSTLAASSAEKWPSIPRAKAMSSCVVATCYPTNPIIPRQTISTGGNLGPDAKLSQPIVSLRWRARHLPPTTGDRFHRDATEINDLFIEGGPYVDRLYATLKNRNRHASTQLTTLTDSRPITSLLCPLPTRDGRVDVPYDDLPAGDKARAGAGGGAGAGIARQGGLAHWSGRRRSLKGPG